MRRRRRTGRARRPTRSARPISLPLVVTALAIAATQSAWSVVVPVMPHYVQQFSASALDLGVVIALFGVGRLAANVPAGMLCRRLDPRWLLMGAVGVVVASMVATGYASSLVLVWVLRLVTGLAGGTAITAGMVLIALLADPVHRGRAMSLLQSMQLVGSSFGLALGGITYGLGGVRAPFLACGVLALLVLVIGGPLLMRSPVPRTSTSEPEPEPGATTTDTTPAPPLLADRSFLSLCAACFAVFFHRFGGMQATIPLLAYTVVGMSVTQYGIVQGAISALGLVLAVPVGILSDRRGRKLPIAAGLLIAGAVTPVFLLTDAAPAFVAVLAVSALAIGICSPVQSAFVVDLAPPGRPGTAIGVFRSFGDLAGIIGPVVLGALTDHLGLRAAVLVLSGVLLIPGTLFALLAREQRPAQPTSGFPSPATGVPR